MYCVFVKKQHHVNCKFFIGILNFDWYVRLSIVPKLDGQINLYDCTEDKWLPCSQDMCLISMLTLPLAVVKLLIFTCPFHSYVCSVDKA